MEILPRRPTPLRRDAIPLFGPLSHTLPRPRSAPPHASTLQHSDSLLLTVSVPTLPQAVHLHLHPTEDLFHPEARTTFSNGLFQRLRPEQYRLYAGDVIDARSADRVRSGGSAQRKFGHAEVIVHDPANGIFEGGFTINGERYHVLTREKYLRVKGPHDATFAVDDSPLVVFRDSDSDPAQAHQCSHDAHPFNLNPLHPVRGGPVSPDTIARRDDIVGGGTGSTNYGSTINNTAGCPSTQQVLYMGVALDCNFVQTYGSADAARTQVLNDWNQISALYKSTFNVSLGELVVCGDALNDRHLRVGRPE